MLGNEIFMYMTTGNNPVVARSRIVSAPSLGEQVPVFLDMAKVHYFDGESGKRIGEKM